MKTTLKLLIVLGVLIGIGWMLRPQDALPKATSEPTPSASQSPQTIEGLGYIEPVSELRRLTPKVNGIVRRCVAVEGQSLKSGDVILELDNSVEERALEVAQAKLALAKSRLVELDSGINPHRIRAAERTLERLSEAHRFAVTEFERQSALSARKATTTAESDGIRTLRDQAQIAFQEQEAVVAHLRNHVTPENRAVSIAEVELAQSEVAQAKATLQNTVITAPCDGQVLRYLKREGDGCSLFLNEPAVIFADISHFRVRAEFDERFTARLHTGLKAEIYGSTLGGKTIIGQVVKVESLMGSKTVFARSAAERKDLHVVEVVIDLPNDFSAPVGLRVDVRLTAPDQ
ncbi:MAG: hypothetical protein NT013_16470 [Planctomycetia bacterium]|nr:hypothetical protein [Planctomycetia bacterium]